MPMIDVTKPAEILCPAAKRELARQLTATVAEVEGITTAQGRSTIWVSMDERPADSFVVAGSAPDAPHYCVALTTVEGALDDRQKADFVDKVTRHVLDADGSAHRGREMARVWCHIRELPDGNWGAVGRIWRLSEIAQFAGISGLVSEGSRA